MSAKKYNVAIVGKGYFSIVLALSLIKQGKRVVNISDPTVQFGKGFTGHIGEVEKQFLITWGTELGIAPLRDLDRYLVPSPINLMLDHRLIRLGMSPYQNIIELLRKIPDCFDNYNELLLVKDRDHFNQSILEFAKRIAEISFRFKHFQNFDESIFFQGLPPLIKSIYESFSFSYYSKEMASEEFKLSRRHFVFLAQSFYQKKSNDFATDFELLHLLISALTPRYDIDTEMLEEDLDEIFFKEGGQKKVAIVDDWQFHEGKMSALELSSYEGLLLPSDVYFLGSLQGRYPFQLNILHETLSSFQCCCQFGQALLGPVVGERFVVSEGDAVGTDLPLYEVLIESSSMARFVFYYPKMKGIKYEFLKKEAEVKMKDFLSRFEYRLEADQAQLEYSANADEMINTKNFQVFQRKRRNRPYRSTYFVSNSNELPSGRIEGLQYWGPLKMNSLGPFSFLMEVKNHIL